MKSNNDLFSRLCSALWQELIAQADGWEDLAAFGAPSECGALVAKGNERNLRDILAKFGYTAEKFCRELEARTNYKFLYECFGEILNLLPMTFEWEKESEA